MKKIIFIPSLVILMIVLMSWGRAGHRIISFNASFSFYGDSEPFTEWAGYLSEHASDADYRKSNDPKEGPKHYIDIDNYPEFLENGEIAQSFDAVVEAHGENFVNQQGTLPWATLTTLDSLTACFSRADWGKAAFFASDLGHYVADGHMPLHLTRNYNGQFTGNDGIHSRYESTMINTFQDEISYTGNPVEFIPDPAGYIFKYIYKNYIFMDSIIAADNDAKLVAGNTSSSLYTNTLWKETKHFTIDLFADASNSLASLIYTAWINAGSPPMDATSISNVQLPEEENLIVSYKGLFNRSVEIDFYSPKDSTVQISVYDISGKLLDTLVNSKQNHGPLKVKWKPNKAGKAVYFIVVKSDNQLFSKKILL